MKAPPKGEKDKRIDEIRKILKEALPEYKPVDVAIPDVVSKDYKTFFEE